MRRTPAARRRSRRTLAGAALTLAAVIAVTTGALIYHMASPAASAQVEAPTLTGIPRGEHLEARAEPGGALSAADGVVPDGVSVFADDYPAVARLLPDLQFALRAAAEDAARDGIELDVTSGWRSAAYQSQLLRDAVRQYGSAEEAARWVATPETSAHVPGDAVDIGPADAAAWLADHGAGYGLCRIYGNEPWHYELRPEAMDRGCPPPYADPTQDPRMQQ